MTGDVGFAGGDVYAQVAADQPDGVQLGGALISLVEPSPGYERAYNRYYEDDHFYAGAMAGPWVFQAAGGSRLGSSSFYAHLTRQV